MKMEKSPVYLGLYPHIGHTTMDETRIVRLKGTTQDELEAEAKTKEGQMHGRYLFAIALANAHILWTPERGWIEEI